MDPGRAAMIAGWQSPKGQEGRDTREARDVTGPKRDPRNRVTKPDRPSAGKNQGPPTGKTQGPSVGKNQGRNSRNQRSYKTQDEQSMEFVAGEDKFVLKQSKKKADIRVRERRAKPIDYLAFNLRWIDEDRDTLDDEEDDVMISVPAPVAVVERLNEARLKEVESEITSYQTLETHERNLEYWESLIALCVDRRNRLSPQGPEGRSVGSVSSDVDQILGPKSYEQLEALEKQIRTKLQSQEPIDTDYWEDLLKALLVYKAKAKLSKLGEAIKERRAELLRERLAEEFEDGISKSATSLVWKAPAPSAVTKPSGSGETTSLATKPNEPPAAAEASSSSAPPPGTARFAQSTGEDFSSATKALFEREMARGVSENEEIFAAEETVTTVAKPLWAHKYRPRKPRYFNRVQMGYEWNKYNQTHYDHDNPPPKVVHGYKFNIFYPDLIDKSKAPTFKIIREGGRRRGESFAPAGQEDTCLIRFIAGPPYEDIAFRIVDREWDYSAKRERGFRSSFDKGILQLHFQFKKIYYRK